MRPIYAPQTDQVTENETRHGELSRKAAGECVVLLENDGTLPLEKGQKIALFGMGANYTVKGGTGSGDVNSRSSVTIEEGLRQEGFVITTGDWLSRNRKKREAAQAAYLAEMEIRSKETGMPVVLLGFNYPFVIPDAAAITEEDLQAADTDTAIYVISRNSGEGSDRFDKRGDYLASEAELRDLTLLTGHFEKVILILNIGGVMDLSEIRAIKGIRAIVLMNQLGNIGGLAIADVLDGEVTPSGKLTDTWAKSYADYPSSATFSHNNGNTDDDDYAEGIYVGYRYFDTYGVEPLYPFGYGLSYTQFELEPAGIARNGEEIEVSVKVTNAGNTYAGKEVVQVYVSAPQGALDKPVKELKAYGKTSILRPGESKVLTIAFPARSLASYSEEKAAWVLEAGEYTILVGQDSRNVKAAGVVKLSQEIVAEQDRNLFPADPARKTPLEERKGRQGGANAEGLENAALKSAGNVSVIELSKDVLATKTTVYVCEHPELTAAVAEKVTLQDVKAGKYTVEDLVSQLTDRELASYCSGRFAKEGEDFVIGMASMVPGGAGDTSSICEESRGIRPLIMADGPAGLRLQPHFKARRSGQILPGGAVFGDAIEPFPDYENPEDVVDYYQYTTAIPIGWGLAQSWNTELIEEVADMVGEEMETFGIDIWLAPAMNIHRNPLCGRNFEYYSEDPVVSGMTAAAITKGVQSHPGKAVCIKHFAANNQEDNRYCTNAHISERAFREIYLKGFEICIRKEQPISIMTSYNLVNGVHTANSRDLLQSATRDEWGYEGFIMTDWYSTQRMEGLMSADSRYDVGDVAGGVYAGNDVQMPGSQWIEDTIVEALESGKSSKAGFTVTKGDLQFCAANVIKAVIRCGEL